MKRYTAVFLYKFNTCEENSPWPGHWAYTDTAMASSCSTLLLSLLILSTLCVATANVQVWGIRGSGIGGDSVGNPDPYVKVYCGGTFGGMTEFKNNDANPSWTASFSFPNGKVGDVLQLELWDKDSFKDDKLGTCTTTVEPYSSSKVSCSFRKGKLEFNYGV
ncbi:hypothetical protein ACEWY4_011764 [Coilia grayii]|uniref:C2 domain-containing protein n=1 Tax=Coilia grayii TaxID=363190 RepID=A0ABD1JYS7_9TELE